MSETLSTLTAKVGALLKKHQLRLITAESCTGGGLSYWLTSIPGSSEWFECGLVTYSNTAKMSLLGVKAKTLEAHGAVSEETAREMAEGALQQQVDTNISISITGIAGPDGGTKQKPVGTVWIALASKQIPTEAYANLFAGDRDQVRTSTIMQSLQLLLAYLQTFQT